MEYLINLMNGMGCYKVLARGLFYAASGTAFGAVGAKIMLDAGHAGYSILETSKAGAAGNAVVGTSLGMLKEIYSFCCDSSKEDDKINFRKWISEAAIVIGASTLGGMLGHAMLNHLAEITLSETAAAMAVGSSTLIASALIFSLTVGCCLITYDSIVAACNKEPSISTSTNRFSLSAHARFHGLFFASSNKNEKALSAIEPTPALGMQV